MKYSRCTLVSAEQRGILFPNIFTSQYTSYAPVDAAQHVTAKAHCWLTIYSEPQVLFPRAAYHCTRQARPRYWTLHLSFWIFVMFLSTHSSPCIGPSKRRTVIPLTVLIASPSSVSTASLMRMHSVSFNQYPTCLLFPNQDFIIFLSLLRIQKNDEELEHTSRLKTSTT